jgi:hypothetical protein
MSRDPWQPIASAPKDGTMILLVSDEDPEHIQPCQWSEVGWLSPYSYSTYFSGGFDGPTHWMPMPSPPEPA